MSPELITTITFEALKTALLVAAPVMLAGLAAGLLVSIFQAVTQINEMTLVFIPKILAVTAALLIFFPWMLKVITAFTDHLLRNIPTFIR
jgi:flagellar biosynthesis protein FliQ